MQKVLSVSVISIIVALSAACASTPHQAKELEDYKLDVKGTTGDGTIGLNEKNQIMIHKERAVQDELRVQDLVNDHFRDEVKRELFELQQCRTDLADPRLGGDGEVTETVDMESIKNPLEETEEMGLTEDGDLKIVSKSFLDKKLANDRHYEASLRAVLKTVKPQKAACERKLGYARNRHGLPTKRVEADGYFTSSGAYVETRRGEGSVQDAFEIQAENKAAHK
jgi:hypothetical protein